MTSPPGTSTAPRRRSTDAVRAAVLAAAAEEFTALGYPRTTMRSVAAAASVSLSVLHRHFPSKEALFTATLAAPFARFLREFTGGHAADPAAPRDEADLVSGFVESLYRALTEQRSTLVSLLAAADAPDGPLSAALREAFDELRVGLRAAESAGGPAAGLAPEAAPHANRMIVALVTGLVVLRPLLMDDPESDDRRQTASATDVLLRGLFSSRLSSPGGERPPR